MYLPHVEAFRQLTPEQQVDLKEKGIIVISEDGEVSVTLQGLNNLLTHNMQSHPVMQVLNLHEQYKMPISLELKWPEEKLVVEFKAAFVEVFNTFNKAESLMELDTMAEALAGFAFTAISASYVFGIPFQAVFNEIVRAGVSDEEANIQRVLDEFSSYIKAKVKAEGAH